MFRKLIVCFEDSQISYKKIVYFAFQFRKHLFYKHESEHKVCKDCHQKTWQHVYHFCIQPENQICEVCDKNFENLKQYRSVLLDFMFFFCFFKFNITSYESWFRDAVTVLLWYISGLIFFVRWSMYCQNLVDVNSSKACFIQWLL